MTKDPASGWIDSAILIVLLIGAVFAIRAYLKQHEFDDVLEVAYRSSHSEGEGVIDRRLAIPVSMRRGVPRLLAMNAQPALFDPSTVSAYGLARRGVTHVLCADAETRAALRGATVSSTPLNAFELLSLDRPAARRERLTPGRRIVWLDSRPYVYPPLADAAVLVHQVPMIFKAKLDPGRYEFRLDVFSPNRGEVTIRADLPDAPPKRERLQRVAHGPLVYPFELKGDEARRVRIAIRAAINEGKSARTGFINRAALYRTR